MEAVAARRRRALPDGIVPPSLLYEGYRLSHLWMEVARNHAPPGLETFYRETFRAWFPSPGSHPHLVGLGTGGGWKEGWLQEQVAASRFTPLDVSDGLALLAAHHLRWMVREVPRPVVADLTAFPDLPQWLSNFDHGTPRLFTAFGLTPNLPAEELDRVLTGYLRPEDALLISANLLPEDGIGRILPQYENAETRRWLFELLAQWGLHADLEEITFRVEHSDRETIIFGETRWSREVAFTWEDLPFSAPAGTALRVFSTRRYTAGAFRKRLATIGLVVAGERVSDCGQEGLWMVVRKR